MAQAGSRAAGKKAGSRVAGSKAAGRKEARAAVRVEAAKVLVEGSEADRVDKAVGRVVPVDVRVDRVVVSGNRS